MRPFAHAEGHDLPWLVDDRWYEKKDHVQYLLRLCELELTERERRMIERRIKAAKFPATKSLDSFDFKAIPSLNKPLVLELARCEYIDKYQNIMGVSETLCMALSPCS